MPYTRSNVAFGGSPSYRGARDFRSHGGAPWDVTRSWDRGHRHFWNNRYYGWNGADWVVFNSGAGFYYGAPYGYADSIPAYDDEEVAVAPDTYNRAEDSLASEVQAALADRGYDPGPVDGDLGPQTRSAIARYQADHGWEPTGHLNASLLSSLGLH